MNRGAVVIGIDNYPHVSGSQLQAAVTGAKAVADWAKLNGIEVKLLTDEKADEVTFTDVRKAIEDFVLRSGAMTLDQLIVYFAGHGISKGWYQEYWLLTDAPRASSEAINLRSSIGVARGCSGIRHVVFISDTCRTTPDGIDGQEVKGGVPFPSIDRETSSEVDVFYAARPGRPSQEVQVLQDAVKAYKAIYTECLVDALKGREATIIDELKENGNTVRVVTPEKLGPHLFVEVRKRVAALELPRAQDPDAVIQIHQLPVYLSRLPITAGVAPDGEPPPAGEPPPTPPVTPLATIASNLIDGALSGAISDLGTDLLTSRPDDLSPDDASRRGLLADAMAVASAPGRRHFESGAGFTIHGATVKEGGANSSNARCEILDDGDGVFHVRTWSPDGGELREPSSVLIEFSDGFGCVLPTIPEYIGTAVVDGGEIVNVSYEPSMGSGRRDMYDEEAERLNVLRSIVAAASREGAFRVHKDSAGAIADRIRYLKSIDPTLGLYAAYAYDDAGMSGDVLSVASYMRDDLGVSLFDVAMLGRQPHMDEVELRAPEVTPFCPLLSQGWSLLAAKRVRLPKSVEAARPYVAPSLWTMFEPEGVRLIRKAMLEDSVL